MAKGYPDYFGQSIWPKYGTLRAEDIDTPILAGDTARVVNISLQGVIYTGYIRIAGATLSPTIELAFTFDSFVTGFNDVSVYLDNGFISGGRVPIVCACYDIVHGMIIFTLGHEIPIHDLATVDIHNDSAFDITCQTRIGYYQVV